MNKTDIRVFDLKAENSKDTLGSGRANPKLSWKIETKTKDWIQRAWELEVYYPETSQKGYSGRVESDRSIHIPWPFDELDSKTVVLVRVRVWGESAEPSDWSEPLHLETGLLEAKDWTASFITPDRDERSEEASACPYLRREFRIRKGLRAARLYASAMGLYQGYINGSEIGDTVFSPGWTSYDRRLLYQSYDITDLLQEGENAIGAVLSEGWYSGRIGFEGGRRNIWGAILALLMQLELRYDDGSLVRVVTDENWRSSTGAFMSSGIYDGERYDARLEPEGWKNAGFDDSAWSKVRIEDHDFSTMTASSKPPVRRQERLPVQEIIISPSGKTLIDFGQNLVGRLRIRARGNIGSTIRLRHAEVLENGELGTRPLRLAEATDTYTCKGGGEEAWEPLFTFHGFRYAEVEGWPGDLKPDDIEAVVLHSDMERTGWFETSNELLNRLHENVRWSMKGNFLEIPTDCPQRDERLGWTGDLQVFSPTASFLYDCEGFLRSWLRDLAEEQKKNDGAVPHVVPNVLAGMFSGAAAWGDAATVVPWLLYHRFGNMGVLEEQFDSMCAWVDFIAEKAGDNFLWDSGFQFGDWLDPTAAPDQPWNAKTDRVIVATAYFEHSSKITAQAAELLGRKKEAEAYSLLADRVKSAFSAEYITPSGRMMCDAETAYALAVVFDLFINEAQRSRAGERLAELVREGGYHIRTGFVGTPLIADALCNTGHHRDAYRLLTQTENPSWLYPVTMGATTIWERWDSMLPDGTINPGEMTSFNHYALGAVADWMHRIIGGIEAAEPGYRCVRVAPRPGGGITSCNAEHISPYGEIRVEWMIESGEFRLRLSLPPNTRAEVFFPGHNKPVLTGSGEYEWSVPYSDPDLRGPFTADDPVGEILNEPKAGGIFLTVLDELEVPDFLRAIIFKERNMQLSEVCKLLPEPDAALQMIIQRLGSS